jgi:hypothetical protein
MNTPRRIDRDQIFWGILLIAAGTIALLSRFEIGDLSWIFRNFWPMFVIAIGLSKLLHRKSAWSGLSTIAIGVWLQAVTLHLYGFSYSSSWPLLLVILGAGTILRAIFGAARRHDVDESGSDHV